jgi:hypothetical protein
MSVALMSSKNPTAGVLAGRHANAPRLIVYITTLSVA